MIYYITSKNNKNISFAYKLKNKKYQNIYKKYLSEGFYNFELALKAKIVDFVIALYPLETIDEKIPQYIVNEEILKKLSFCQNPQGIIFVCNMKFNPLIKKERLIYLDNIQDPGNLGTIIRTAFAFDYDGIILSKNTCSIYNEKTVASSKGAIYTFPIIVDDLKNYKATHFIISSSLENQSINLEQSRANSPFIICLGNEANGISEETKKLSNEFIKINIKNIDSLNVAVAAGILLYELKDK